MGHDWTTLSTTEAYASVPADIAGRDSDAITWAQPTAGTPTNAKFWNSSTGYIQQYNGSAYVNVPYLNQWNDYADVPSFVSATSFTVLGNLTARYPANSRLQIIGGLTWYGFVNGAPSYNGGTNLTTITVTLDSGSLTNTLTAVRISILTPDLVALPPVPFSKLISQGNTALGFIQAAGVPLSTVTVWSSGTPTWVNGTLYDATATVSATLPDAGSQGQAYTLAFKNSIAAGTVTVTPLATNSDTIDGSANALVLRPGDVAILETTGGHAWRNVSETYARPKLFPIAQTSNFAVSVTQHNGTFQRLSSGAVATLPTSASAGNFIVGFINTDGSACSIATAGGDTLAGTSSLPLPVQWTAVWVLNSGSGVWDIISVGTNSPASSQFDGLLAELIFNPVF